MAGDIQLFQRAVRLTVDTQQIEGLDVQFKVRKTSNKEPNTCECSVYNLSQASRALLGEKGIQLTLDAGYVGTLAQIFRGNATCYHEHVGADWITRLSIVDGERSYRYALVNENFKPGTMVHHVVARVASALNLDVTDAVNLVRANNTEQFTQGYVAHGRASTELDKLLKGRGFEWSIQDGRLQVLLKGTTTSHREVVLTPDSGLIGSPTFGTASVGNPEPGQKRGPRVLKLKSLLQPDLKPGRRVHVESEGIKGTFRILTVTHSGDTSGADWYSDVEAQPL